MLAFFGKRHKLIQRTVQIAPDCRPGFVICLTFDDRVGGLMRYESDHLPIALYCGPKTITSNAFPKRINLLRKRYVQGHNLSRDANKMIGMRTKIRQAAEISEDF